jgi:hypothetical protein
MKYHAHRLPRSGVRLPLVAAALLAVSTPGLATAGGSAFRESGKPCIVRASGPLGDLDALSESAEELYQLALAGKLERAGRRLDALKKNVAALSSLPNQPNIILPRLGQTMVDLEQACGSKDRLEMLRYANRVTLIAATLAVPLKPRVPTEVALLDYNSRELAIWSDAHRLEKVNGIVIRMHLAWQTLMPKLIENNGLKELRRFSDLMGRLEQARTPEEYSRISRLIAPELDTMKVIFSRQGKRVSGAQ